MWGAAWSLALRDFIIGWPPWALQFALNARLADFTCRIKSNLSLLVTARGGVVAVVTRFYVHYVADPC